MLRTLARRAAEPARQAFDFERNPYKAKRLWPPDFSKLPPKHQFRFERKFRRRMNLKWARPRYHKIVKLSQWAIITFVTVYSVLFLDWSNEIKAKNRTHDDGQTQPFQGIRNWYRNTVDSIWSKPASQSEQPRSSTS